MKFIHFSLCHCELNHLILSRVLRMLEVEGFAVE